MRDKRGDPPHPRNCSKGLRDWPSQISSADHSCATGYFRGTFTCSQWERAGESFHHMSKLQGAFNDLRKKSVGIGFLIYKTGVIFISSNVMVTQSYVKTRC